MSKFRARVGVRTRRLTALVGLTAAALALAACGGSSDSEESASAGGDTKLRVANVAAFGTLPLHVAQKQGIFAKHGLEVEMTEGLDVAAWTAALGKQYDISFTTPPHFFAASSRGVGLSAVSHIMVVTNENPNAVLVTAKPITSLADLKGKTIGVPTLTGLAADALKYNLLAEGIEASDYKFVQVDYGSVADQLKTGRIFATVSPSPFFNQLKASGYSLWPTDMTVQAAKAASDGKVQNAIGAFYNASSGWAEKNPEAVTAWRDSLQEAIEWIAANPDEARTELVDWLKLPAAVAQQTQLPEYAVDITADQLEPYATISRKTGALTGDLPPMADLVWSK
jgi:ABC-type nitrate/sulfonate/bicarbonate transport system substrate-binding protein